jgi:hypothetical protein
MIPFRVLPQPPQVADENVEMVDERTVGNHGGSRHHGGLTRIPLLLALLLIVVPAASGPWDSKLEVLKALLAYTYGGLNHMQICLRRNIVG